MRVQVRVEYVDVDVDVDVVEMEGRWLTQSKAQSMVTERGTRVTDQEGSTVHPQCKGSADPGFGRLTTIFPARKVLGDSLFHC